MKLAQFERSKVLQRLEAGDYGVTTRTQPVTMVESDADRMRVHEAAWECVGSTLLKDENGRLISPDGRHIQQQYSNCTCSSFTESRDIFGGGVIRVVRVSYLDKELIKVVVNRVYIFVGSGDPSRQR